MLAIVGRSRLQFVDATSSLSTPSFSDQYALDMQSIRPVLIIYKFADFSRTPQGHSLVGQSNTQCIQIQYQINSNRFTLLVQKCSNHAVANRLTDLTIVLQTNLAAKFDMKLKQKSPRGP